MDARFFNQLIAAFNGWLDTRNDPAKAITFGDGSPLNSRTSLPPAPGRRLTFDLLQAGDLALVDNYTTMHGRRTFTGTRKILASPWQRKTFSIGFQCWLAYFPANHDAFILAYQLGGLLEAQSVLDSATPVRNISRPQVSGSTYSVPKPQQGSWWRCAMTTRGGSL